MTTSSTTTANGSADTEVVNATDNNQESKKVEALALSVKSEPEKTRDSSGIQIYNPGGLPGNRPITVSSLKIAETYSAVGGNRPIFASEMEIASSLVASGNRPIAKSTLQISSDIQIMGNRPVAPNEDDDINILMGYID